MLALQKMYTFEFITNQICYAFSVFIELFKHAMLQCVNAILCRDSRTLKIKAY